MKKFFWLVLIFFVAVSCKKTETSGNLTDGTWLLQNGIPTSSVETIKFNSDGSFVIESESEVLCGSKISGSITGKYELNDDIISFKSTLVAISGDTTQTGIASGVGQPLVIYNGDQGTNLWQTDSISSGNTIFRFRTSIFRTGEMENKQWKIKSLSEQYLVVEMNKVLIKYKRL